jgi:SAM-dependent methyltransferase
MPSTQPRTHPAVRGFDRAADAYERARPGYPAEAVRFLGRALGLRRGRTVVELGSGTGKFTRALAPLGAARVAVEPTAGMRAVFERTVPDVPLLDGTAEAIPLFDGFADAVVAAQAFHWFRPWPAVREIARVLRPGGGVGLVWNTRDESVDWSRRMSEIFDRYGWATPRTKHRRWRSAFDDVRSPFLPIRQRTFRHFQSGSPAMFVDRVLSVSVIAVQPPAERRRIAEEFREVLRRDPLTRGRRTLTLPYRTEVYWTKLRPEAVRR